MITNMTKQKEYFDLSLDSLRILGKWTAVCSEQALPIYEAVNPNDPRPQAAIAGIREFAIGGKRVAALRKLSMDAYRAALETEDKAASAAAQSASLAAASAYTHPLVDAAQTKHIVGPAAYAAQALEINAGNIPDASDEFVLWAINQVPEEVCGILMNMPARTEGKTRLDKLMFDLDQGLRKKFSTE
jgi:hypothetical protein